MLKLFELLLVPKLFSPVEELVLSGECIVDVDEDVDVKISAGVILMPFTNKE
jgi:hypothetical protein